MAYTILVHLNNTDPIYGEVEELPSPGDNFLHITNARTKDGKDLRNIETTAASLIFPWHRIGFIEVMQADEDEDVIGFIRE